MKVGYVRVSRDSQNPDLQQDALTKFGCEKIFSDTACGAIDSRTGLKDALDFVRTGDLLVVWRLDRLGRSLQHLIETVNSLNGRGAGFCSLQENLDSSTSGGRLVFHLFGALAQFERDLIRERTIAGLKAARERGRLGGRPLKLSPGDVELVRRMASDRTAPIADICRRFAISKTTLYRALGEKKI